MSSDRSQMRRSVHSLVSPFEAVTHRDASKLDAHVRAKIEHENAQALLKLNQPGA
jgi:hypothetical protein